MFNVLSSERTWCLVDIEMKAYNKPCMMSFSVVSSDFMVASKELGVTTPMGGFYYCNKAGCKTDNPLNWNETESDSRDITESQWVEDSRIPIWGGYYKTVKVWQYIGCYEYKSNGSGVDCEIFHGTSICEGTQWDLFINANNEYYVRPCPDGVH